MPSKQVVFGVDPSVVVNRVVEGTGNFGFNAAVNEYGDMVEGGVLDPCKVTRTALQNAASITGLVLTTQCLVALRPEPRRATAAPSAEEALL